MGDRVTEATGPGSIIRLIPKIQTAGPVPSIAIVLIQK